MKNIIKALILFLLIFSESYGDENLSNQILKNLRCLVCQNENIDSSNADLAKDLRLLVRERLLVGDTNKQVKNFIVERYGEYVLLNPTFSGSSILLWISGPLIFILSLIFERIRSKRYLCILSLIFLPDKIKLGFRPIFFALYVK